ncbi:unnamed protein product [Lathyrus oleraceus]
MAKFNCSFFLFITLLLQLNNLCSSLLEQVPTPPLPILPLPTYSQLKWQQREIIMFLHFGVNTFSDREHGTGHENPSIFNPIGLNTTQWASVAEEAGMSLMILTAKHHDGFCLWPSKYTKHSVISSTWQNGKGDVVQEFVNAATHKGIDVGFYLSPWDRHDSRYGHDLLYNEYYLAQLQELLKKYPNVREIWFDGFKDPEAQNVSYYFSDWFSMVKELQSSINIFSDAGSDVRWVGNEKGIAGDTCWSTINRSSLTIGSPDIKQYLNTGDPRGTDWLPAECDVSIRRGWFWHKSESPKKLTEGCYVKVSSQRGGKEGGFGPENMLDSDHLGSYWAPREDDKEKEDHWVEIWGNDGDLRFNVIRIQEAIGFGQRIKSYEIYVDGRLIIQGTTVGYKRLHRLDGDVVKARVVRIRFIEAGGVPLISSIGLYFDPFWYSGFNAT